MTINSTLTLACSGTHLLATCRLDFAFLGTHASATLDRCFFIVGSTLSLIVIINILGIYMVTNHSFLVQTDVIVMTPRLIHVFSVMPIAV